MRFSFEAQILRSCPVCVTSYRIFSRLSKPFSFCFARVSLIAAAFSDISSTFAISAFERPSSAHSEIISRSAGVKPAKASLSSMSAKAIDSAEAWPGCRCGQIASGESWTPGIELFCKATAIRSHQEFALSCSRQSRKDPMLNPRPH